jgi:hypothetical protein
MLRNICYANARQYMAFPTADAATEPRKRSASRSNGDTPAKRSR